jgi:bifunctional DNA-binding transcriptional regulator/antitoxin component of YhaV-PrlF toxin-antitoxin module
MAEKDILRFTGKVFIDSKGAGRIYLKKKIVELMGFESGEEVQIDVIPGDGLIVVAKLDRKTPIYFITGADEEWLKETVYELVAKKVNEMFREKESG